MLTWEEINKIENRELYVQEYTIRKSYDKMLPRVDELYSVFAIYAWSKGYNNIAKSGARKCWCDFVAENKGNAIGKRIEDMENAICSRELKEYFNNKIKTQKEIKYYEQ